MIKTPSTFEIYRRKIQKRLSGTITLKPDTRRGGSSTTKGRLLFSYFTDPFLLLPGQSFSTRHSNYWEAHEIASIFLEKGYVVDVIDEKNTSWQPKRRYELMFSTGPSLERLSGKLGPDCKTIFYILTSHWKANNANELARLEDLKKRVGVTLATRRLIPPNKSFELAHCVVGLGNQVTFNTFLQAGSTSGIDKQIWSVPSSTISQYPAPKKAWAEARKRFVWIGGGGAVHKGLDLVLEVFKKNTDLILYVCGPVQAEVDFVQLYQKELFETSNIHTVGRIDVAGKQFADICGQCVAIVHPSCAEGQSGAVITAMHAGLIPIVSRESGVNVQDFGKTLDILGISEIEQAVRDIATSEPSSLSEQAHGAWEHARLHYTRETFSKTFRSFIENVLQ